MQGTKSRASYPLTFAVYSDPDRRNYLAVKNGFSWPGFFFGFWWALFTHQWARSVLLLVITFCLVIPVVLAETVTDDGWQADLLEIALYLPFLLWVGWRGNAWYRESLEHRGFVCRAENINAPYGDAAIKRFRSGAADQGDS